MASLLLGIASKDVIINGSGLYSTKYCGADSIGTEGQNGRKLFAVFDFSIDDVFVLLVFGTHQYRAVSQRPRAALHAALKPADNFVFGKQPGGSVLDVLDVFCGNAPVLEHPFYLCITITVIGPEYRSSSDEISAVFSWK
jgi:hypothetical protein